MARPDDAAVSGNDGARAPYGSNVPFSQRLAFSSPIEESVAAWLEQHRRRVTLLARGDRPSVGGPRLYDLDGSFTAPDLLVIAPGRPAKLLEVRGHRAATWYLRGRYWCTGIPLLDLDRLEEAEVRTGVAVWLAVVLLGRGDRHVKGHPPPAGLFVAPAKGLRTRASHSYGDAGMIYWRCGDLCRVASLEDLCLTTDGMLMPACPP